MAVPWLRLLDAAIGIGTLARRVTSQNRPPPENVDLATATPGGALEARLAGVVVAALKEAFDRDRQRLDAERAHMEAERQRAERLLRIEIARQAADREIGRLRLMAAVAVLSWLVTLFLYAISLTDGTARALIGVGWLLLLASLGASFAGQSRVVKTLADTGDGSSGPSGAAAGWLLILGLAAIASAVLVG